MPVAVGKNAEQLHASPLGVVGRRLGDADDGAAVIQAGPDGGAVRAAERAEVEHVSTLPERRVRLAAREPSRPGGPPARVRSVRRGPHAAESGEQLDVVALRRAFVPAAGVGDGCLGHVAFGRVCSLVAAEDGEYQDRGEQEWTHGSRG